MREGVDLVGQMYGTDEFFLKIRIDSGFDVFYPIGDFLRLSSFESIQQGDAGAVSRGIADRVDVFKLAIRDQSSLINVKRSFSSSDEVGATTAITSLKSNRSIPAPSI